MGAGAGGYVQIALQTLLSEFTPEIPPAENAPAGTGPTPATLRRVSRLSFSGAQVPGPDHQLPPKLPPPKPVPLPRPKPQQPVPKPTPSYAGKIGLGGIDVKNVARFDLYARLDDGNLMNMQAVKEDHPTVHPITDELVTAFRGVWTGCAVMLAPTGGRFQLVADITITSPFPADAQADKPFTIIPVVMAFGTDQFDRHYLLAVIVAQQTADKVDATVVQPYV